jgi:hypothetical protein
MAWRVQLPRLYQSESESGGPVCLKKLISDIGVKGVWNDMNEPAVMEVPTKHFQWM